MARAKPVEALHDEDQDASPSIPGVQALTRGIALLDIVADSKKPLRFSEIADAAGLTKGTAHRMLAALVEARLLQFDQPTQTYRLGVRVFEMAHRVWNEFDLRGAAAPELERLRDLTGEAVRLGVLQGTELLYIDQREAVQAIRLANGVGGRASVYATSGGKAILAHLDAATRHRLLPQLDLTAFTPTTITSPAALERELNLTVARGYAISVEEQTPGLNSVAAAVLDHRARPLGAICVLGPSFRLPPERLHALGREVMEAARRISGNAGQSLMSITLAAKPHDPARQEVTPVLPFNAFLGEGPTWSEREARLYWVDILAPAIHRSDPMTGTTETLKIPEVIGAVVPRARGGLVAALQGGFKAIDFATGDMTLIAAPEADRPGNRFNDGKCDRQGRFWAGTLALDATPSAGSLYRLDPDGRAHTMETGIHVANGLGWSPDDRVFYFTDSGRRQIYAYDFDEASGAISNKRLFAEVPENAGTPDGLAVDAEGYIWSAHWNGWRVTRYDPQGRIDRVIQMPVPRPTSCAFGGPDLSTLYVTSASVRLSAEQLAESPLSGSVFAIQTGVRGLPETPFAG